MSGTPRREVDERLADWVDGCMSARDRERFLAELRVNPQLKRDLEQYERTVGVLRAALRAPTSPPQTPMADRVVAALAKPAAVAVVRPQWFGPRLAWGCAVAAAMLVAAVWLNAWSSTPQRTAVATHDAPAAFAPENEADMAAQRDKLGTAPAGAADGGGEPSGASDGRTEERTKAMVEGAPAAPAAPKAQGTDPSPTETKPTEAKPGAVVPEELVAAVPPPGASRSVVPAPSAPAPARVPDLAEGASTGNAPGAPAGPSTAGPAGPGARSPLPQAPAVGAGGGGGTGQPPATGSDDFYLGATRRPTAPTAGFRTDAAPDAKGEAKAKTAGGGSEAVPMLAFVAFDGVEIAPLAQGTTATELGKARGGRAADDSAKKDVKRGQPAEPPAADKEASERAAATPLTPAALETALDRFFAAAASPAAEPAADQWRTTLGMLTASPWLDAAPAAERPATPLRERAWLVEGERKDVEVLLRRAAAFAAAHRLNLAQGEMPVPRELAAPSAPAAAGTAGLPVDAPTGGARVAADPMRIVLRFRLRPR